MTIVAIRLEPDGSTETLTLPTRSDDQRKTLRSILNGTVDAGVYHRRALLHVHGGGYSAEHLPFNPAAWALACTWRGMDIGYGLYGTAVVTGPGDGLLAPLEPELQTGVRSVAAAVKEVLIEWRTRPPAGEWAARAELLAAARYTLST
jgi:hypothetical protein